MVKAYKAKWILTCSTTGEQIFEDCALIEENGLIKNIVPQNSLIEEDYENIESFGNAVITPGFVNLGVQPQFNDVFDVKPKGISSKIKGFFQNIHLFFSMLGVPVNSYLIKLAKTQKEYFCFDKADKIQSYKNGIENCINEGITCLAQVVNDDTHVEILKNYPIKSYLFYQVMSDSKKKSKKVFFKLKKKVERFKNIKADNIFMGVYANSIWSVHKSLWGVLSKFSRKAGLLLMTEIAECQDECDWLKYGNSDVDLLNNFYGQKKLSPNTLNMSIGEYLSSLKVLSDNVIIRNGNFLTGDEMEIFGKCGCNFAYSPISNDKNFDKKQKFETIIKYFGNKIGFSSGLSKTDDYNVLNDLFSIEAHIPFEERLKYATIYPAKILRSDDKIGSLENGKDADFNVFKLKYRENITDIKEHKTPICVFVKGKKLVDKYKIL